MNRAPDPAPLAGHTVVVTGGNRGIGLGLAEGVAAAGADVVIWARNAERNLAAIEQLSSRGTSVHAVVCDVADETAVDRAMADTLALTGRVDCLFANAGIVGGAQAFGELALDEWRSVLAVNLDGTFLSLRAAARHMIERGSGGALVGVSSMVTRFGAPGKIPYAVSKVGVDAMIRSLAVELARHRIRANVLAPGWTDTEMLEPGEGFGAQDHDKFRNSTVRRTPARRWGQPADFHAVAAYLADPRHTFHTGDTITVDGGYSAF